MRAAYFIMETVKNEDGEYVPCIAVEGETGYHRTDWAWGTDIDVARQLADKKNADLGLTVREAYEIVFDTMRHEPR